MQADMLVKAIEERLPELAWQVSLLPHAMTLAQLPKHLFTTHVSEHPSACVEEIKRDLHRLYQLRQYEGEYAYLVKRIDQKIDVLIRLCKIHQQTHKNQSLNTRMMVKLNKRRQWVEDIEQQLHDLHGQHQQLLKQMDTQTDASMRLKMQASAGHIQKQITTLKEQLEKMTLSV